MTILPALCRWSHWSMLQKCLSHPVSYLSQTISEPLKQAWLSVASPHPARGCGILPLMELTATWPLLVLGEPRQAWQAFLSPFLKDEGFLSLSCSDKLPCLDEPGTGTAKLCPVPPTKMSCLSGRVLQEQKGFECDP